MSNTMPPPPDQTERARALDTARSCIVQAPAGSGKTTLLASRYLALLAEVKRPEEILAITFTKKAAAEMRHRVLSMLAEDSPLTRVIWQRNTQLGWQIENNPSVLKIQTIDSFAMELSSQTPNASGVLGLDIVENATSHYGAAADALLKHILDDTEFGVLVADFLALLDNDAESARELLSHMLAHRDQWQEIAATAAAHSHSDVGALEKVLKDTVSTLHASLVAQLAAQLNASDIASFDTINGHLGLQGEWYTALPHLLTGRDELRKRLTVKEGFSEAEPRRSLNLWLADLHARGLAESLQALAKAPTASAVDAATVSALQVCCINLSLAIVELERRFDEQRLTDFTGLLISARRALRDEQGSPTDLALYLDYRIHHVLVDEFQDTSRSQFSFFNLLLESWDLADNNTFFAVGDPMQSIYRFRDADVNIFGECLRSGIAGVALDACQLTANFRSSEHLIYWCNDLFAGLFSGPATTLGSVPFTAAQAMRNQQPEQTAVNCTSFIETSAETEHVVQQIEALLEQTEDTRIGVLCRSRAHVAPLLSRLKQKDIAWQATDMDLLKNRTAISDLLALHGLLCEPTERLAWYTLLRTPMFGLELPALTHLADASDLQAALADMSADARIERLLNATAWAASRYLERPLREVIEGFWLRCGGADAYSHAEQEDVRRAFDLLESKATRDMSNAELQQLLENLYAAPQGVARVEVMTVHKSKGLEFDHVFVPYLHKTTQSDDPRLFAFSPTAAGTLLGVRGDAVHRWLHYEERERARNEEKRLLYVACTRARSSLWLSYTHDGERQPAGLARWLATHATAADTLAHNPAPGAGITQNLQQDLFERQINKRLPAHYIWSPVDYQALPTTGLDNKSVDAIANRYEVMLGNLVHQCLAWIAQQQQGSRFAPPPVHALDKILQYWAQAQPTDMHNISTATLVADGSQQLQQVMHSESGQWVLFPHTQHEVELALSGRQGNTVRNIVLDRTFVDEAGQRWVIDYKTSRLEDPGIAETRIAHIQQRYAPQLKLYARIAGKLFGEEVKTALFLTDLAEFLPYQSADQSTVADQRIHD